MKLKKIFGWRVWVLIIVLFLALIAINPSPFAKGLVIKTVDEVSKEYLTPGDLVNSLNDIEIQNAKHFEEVLVQESANKEYNGSAKLVFETDVGRVAFLAKEKPKIILQEQETSTIILGMDLAGGTRVLLEPKSDEEITDRQITDLISVLDNRLNVYGLSDLNIRSARDWEGSKFVLVEIAGATRDEVKELIGEQGVFEAKIGDDIIFAGSEKDITYVCKDDGSCSGIRRCDQSEDGYYCRFEFVIHISPESAKRHAGITENLEIIHTEGRSSLSKNIDFYLDDIVVDSLNISSDLKGKEATQILITGPGTGGTEEKALLNARENMNKLQTILITGSLPFKLEIVKLDTISPLLGKTFINNAMLTGLFAILVVGLIVFLRYRKLKVVVPMIFTTFFEVFLILGFAAVASWRLDLAAIAGIIAAVGTGVDHQIIITDEVLKGSERYFNWKQKIKRAFFIIISAYFTTLVAMTPLLLAGAGLLRGFALTTIVGITIGVLITRPAFASVIEVLLEE